MLEADVVLRNGRQVHLRAISPADGAALRVFHASLSDHTVYLRFFTTKRTLSDADVEYFTGVDHHDRVALVALADSTLIGVCRYDSLGTGSAEVAFVIRDDMQGLGLGSLMLQQLAAAARERGVTRFIAEVLPENIAMLATFASSGFDVTQRREREDIVVEFSIVDES